ncbi:MAG: glycosyltransferase [Chthoniobacteraceae bacterium]
MESGVFLALPLGVMCLHRAAVWLAARRKRVRVGDGGMDPVTWLRPLKPGVPGIARKLEEFLGCVGVGDEVIFGVEEASAEVELCRVLAARWSCVKVVVCERGAAANPKVAKLLAMTPGATHSRWILADAEALIDAEFADAFRREWSAGGADVLTAGYHFTGMKTWPQWMDALAIIQTLWPGLEVVRAFGRMTFTLGACTAVRRSDIEAIGGWEALACELAEDRRLGALLVGKGRRVRLSEAILSMEVDPIGWRDYWRHQRRVAVTYRVATPMGALGMIVTRGFSLSLLVAVIFPSWMTLACLVAAAVLHLGSVAGQARRLGVKLGPHVGLSLIAELVETACWALSWLSRRVWWGGKWRWITWRGQIDAGKNGRAG